MLLPVHQNASASSSTCSPRRRRAGLDERPRILVCLGSPGPHLLYYHASSITQRTSPFIVELFAASTRCCHDSTAKTTLRIIHQLDDDDRANHNISSSTIQKKKEALPHAFLDDSVRDADWLEFMGEPLHLDFARFSPGHPLRHADKSRQHVQSALVTNAFYLDNEEHASSSSPML